MIIAVGILQSYYKFWQDRIQNLWINIQSCFQRKGGYRKVFTFQHIFILYIITLIVSQKKIGRIGSSWHSVKKEECSAVCCHNLMLLTWISFPGLCDMLPMDHVEGLVETIRVFGNLTHFREIRDIVTKRAG